MGETRVTLQHFCSNFNERVLSPNGREVLMTLLIKCVSGEGTGWKLPAEREEMEQGK